tara:strand:- start:1169 stop:1543 length:375 start_codon:yes stop_codon:yes gene_type:complete
MATRRRTSAVKSTTAKKTPRTVVKKTTVTSAKSVNKITPIEEVKVTKTPVKVEAKSVKKPALVRPVKTNLTRADYLADFKVRWEIHQFETQELGRDLAKLYQVAIKFTLDSVNYVKESYNSAFN